MHIGSDSRAKPFLRSLVSAAVLHGELKHEPVFVCKKLKQAVNFVENEPFTRGVAHEIEFPLKLC